MSFQAASFSVILLVAAAINVIVSIVAWTRRAVRAALPLAVLAFSCALWAAGSFFMLSAGQLSTNLLLAQATALAEVAVPVAWVVFSLAYSGHSRWINPRTLGLLCLVPAVTLALVWTMGPQDWFGVSFLYSTLLFFFGSVLILRDQLSTPHLFWGQRMTLVLSLSFPWIASLLHLLGIPPWLSLDLTPFALLLTGLGLAWSLFGFRLLDVMPLDRQDVRESQADGLLVFDSAGRLVDYNQAAGRILNIPLQGWIGKPAGTLLDPWPELNALAGEKIDKIEWTGPHAATEAQPGSAPTGRITYEASVSPVVDAHQVQVGRSILLHALTHSRQVEALLKRRTGLLDAVNQAIESSAAAENMKDALTDVLGHVLNALNLEMGVAGYQQVSVSMGLEESQPDTASILDTLMLLEQAQEDKSQTMLCINNLADFDRKDSLPGVQAALCAPIPVPGGSSGRLAVFSTLPRSWSEDEIALLRAAAWQLSLAGEKLNSAAHATQQETLLSRLKDYSEAFNYCMEEEEVLATICQGASNLIATDRVEVQLLSPYEFRQETAEGEPVQDVLRQAPQPVPVLVPDVREQLAAMEDQQVAQSIDYQALGIWPLVYQGETLAMLRCYYDHPYHWSEIEQEVMQVFSRQSAVALENSRLFSAERRQRSFAETLRDLATNLSTSLDETEILAMAFNDLAQIIPCDLALIQAVESEHLRLVQSQGFHGAELEKLEASLDRCLSADIPGIQAAVKTLQPVVMEDTRDDTGWTSFWKAAQARSYLVVPVAHQGELIALIHFFSRLPQVYTPQIVQNMQAVATQVAIAAQNAHLYLSLQKQAAEISSLYRALTLLFNPGGDVRSVADQVIRAVLQEFTEVHAGVLLVDDSGRVLKPLAWSGYPLQFQQPLWLDGSGLTVAAFNSGTPVYVPDVSQDPRYVASATRTSSELALPLLAHGRVIGVLDVEHPLVNAFDDRSRRVLGALADHAALALENALLFDAANLQLRQLNLLNEITRISLAEADFNSMLEKVAERTRQLFDADICFINLWDDSSEQVSPGAAAGANASFKDTVHSGPGEPSFTLHVLEKSQVVAVEDVRRVRYVSQRFAADYQLVSLLGIPLVADQQRYGAVILGYQQPRRFSPREITLGEQAGGQIALALARAKSLDLSQRRAREADNLRRATEALTGDLDLAQILKNILKHLARVLTFDSAAVFLLEPRGLRAVSAVGPSEMTDLIGRIYPAENALAQEVMQRHYPLILEDAQADNRFENWGSVNHIRGWMGVPLVTQGRPIGFLTIDSRQPGAYDREQSWLAQAFANQVAIAIQTARLFDESQSLAITDPLTGLYNRRGYTEMGHREIERARRYKRPLAAIMLDIDHFKQVNDQFKHATGDVVLRELALRCRERMREIDILGRYGGEELVLLLPETNLEGAMHAAESLRERVASQTFKTHAGELTITISLGVAVYTGGDMDLEKLIDCADDAMYAAKQAGRNRVRPYTAE